MLISYLSSLSFFIFFFFNDTATTEIYTLSLHDALPIYPEDGDGHHSSLGGGHQDWRHACSQITIADHRRRGPAIRNARSEEHTSELQSPCNLVCRLLLEKKKIT